MKNLSKLSNLDFKFLSFITISNTRRAIVISILDGNLFPSQIHKDTRLRFSTVSKNLKQLTFNKVIKCVNPSERVGRIYTPTERTILIESHIRKINEKFIEERK